MKKSGLFHAKSSLESGFFKSSCDLRAPGPVQGRGFYAGRQSPHFSPYLLKSLSFYHSLTKWLLE